MPTGCCATRKFLIDRCCCRVRSWRILFACSARIYRCTSGWLWHFWQFSYGAAIAISSRARGADYTLRRLPQRHARFRYCWSLPLLEAATILLLMVVMLLIFYGYYMYLTPDACLAPGQWQKLQQAGWGILW